MSLTAVTNILTLLGELNKKYCDIHTAHWNNIYIIAIGKMEEETRINQVREFSKLEMDEIVYAFQFNSPSQDDINRLSGYIALLAQ